MTNEKETDARIRIDKKLLDAGWKLPGHVDNDNQINVRTETKNKSGEADYVLLGSKDNHICTIEAKKLSFPHLLEKNKRVSTQCLLIVDL